MSDPREQGGKWPPIGGLFAGDWHQDWESDFSDSRSFELFMCDGSKAAPDGSVSIPIRRRTFKSL